MAIEKTRHTAPKSEIVINLPPVTASTTLISVGGRVNNPGIAVVCVLTPITELGGAVMVGFPISQVVYATDSGQSTGTPTTSWTVSFNGIFGGSYGFAAYALSEGGAATLITV
jgi:hypothetical protein